MSKELGPEDPEGWPNEEEIEEELCDYTGEECIGDKMFCEECTVLTEEELEPEEWENEPEEPEG
jgi:hypothetical protein